MSQNNNNDDRASIDIGDELSKNLIIHKNIKQEIIFTTSDKIKLMLISTKEVLIAQRDWRTPLGLFISFLTTLCTADFKDVFYLPKESWYAIFVLLAFASVLWFLYCLYKLYKNRGEADIDKIIEKIKLENENEETNKSKKDILQ